MPQKLHLSVGTSDVGDGSTDSDTIAFPTDPVLSPGLASLPTSPSRSRVPTMSFPRAEAPAEDEPLLGRSEGRQKRKKPFYRARPLWIVPFVILASLARGMTIAPRVEVFTQLSCSKVYGPHIDYNHTRSHLPHALNVLHLENTTSDIELPLYLLDVDDGGESDDPMHVPSKRCLSDPTVQAGAARLQMIMTTTMGALSALTTGWWGHFGERHGRVRVLAVATVGLFLTDLMFILVSMPHSPLAAHGHKLLIISPIIEGLLGGWSTLQGATSAYVSDCTSDGSRAHIFSRFTGVFFLGFAVGPMVGAFILTHPNVFPFLSDSAARGRTVTPVFWVAVLCSFVNFLMAMFVFPESLDKEKRKARREAEAAAKAVATAQWEEQGLKKPSGGIFMPLLVFAPKKRGSKTDWNMTLLALCLFGYLLSSGIYQLKYLYAEHVFGWEAEQLSYYVTFVGGARAVHLLFIMPFIISVFKPKVKPSVPSAVVAGSSNGKKPKPTKAQLAAEMRFDIWLSRISYAIDILSHTLVSFSSTAPTSVAQAAFVGFTVLSCFGSGAVPTVQSLALCIVQADAAEEEAEANVNGGATASSSAAVVKAPAAGAGSLFGAFAVLQATGQMILGPILFGLIYSSTVAKFPKGIFVVAASILVIASSLLLLVHPHQVAIVEQKKKTKRSDRTWVDADIERGRSRISKDLSSGSAYSFPSSSSSGSGSQATGSGH